MSNVNKQWNGIADIERDVNASNADIDAIIKSLGLHPTVPADSGSAESSPSTSSLHLENDDSHPDPRAVPPPVGTTHSQTQNPDPVTSASHSDSLFDFDTFFNTFDPNVISTTANPSFLTQSSSVSETQQQSLQSSSTQQQTLQHQQGAPIPGMRVTSGTSKRKSDASDLVIPPIDDMGINTTTLSLNASPSKPTKRRKK
ncbi:hypothetical protein H0H93_016793 [Arthromyces matolae]|nr:hypothetical protein H0H93_016793 [Arthromyces matolae]